jgi:hypothetical protein
MPRAARALAALSQTGPSTEMIIDNIAAYAIRRSDNVVRLPIGKSGSKLAREPVIGQGNRDATGLRCQTPISHTPSNPRSAISSQ